MSMSSSNAALPLSHPPSSGHEPGIYRVPIPIEEYALYLIRDPERRWTFVLTPTELAHERTEDHMEGWLDNVASAGPSKPHLHLVDATPPASPADGVSAVRVRPRPEG